MDNEQNDTSPVDQVAENARARVGSWAGPFRVEVSHSKQFAIIYDAAGNPFAEVAASDCGNGPAAANAAAAKARATLIAETLNKAEPVERPEGQGSSIGSHASLLQSLKCMAKARRLDGAEGHALIAERALTLLLDLEKHVTRFFEYPGLVVQDVKLGDLTVHAATVEGGDVVLTCQRSPGDYVKVKLSEVVPAGPVADVVRIMCQVAARTAANEILNRPEILAALRLKPEDGVDCERCAATGFCGACGGRGWLVPLDGELVPHDVREAQRNAALPNDAEPAK